jgi:hypothetical protein
VPLVEVAEQTRLLQIIADKVSITARTGRLRREDRLPGVGSHPTVAADDPGPGRHDDA